MLERRFYREPRSPAAEMSWWLVFWDDRLEIQKRWTLDSDDGVAYRCEVSGFFADPTEPTEAKEALRHFVAACLSSREFR